MWAPGAAALVISLIAISLIGSVWPMGLVMSSVAGGEFHGTSNSSASSYMGEFIKDVPTFAQ